MGRLRKIFRFWRKEYFVFLLLAILAGGAGYYFKPLKFRVPYPYILESEGNTYPTELACEGLVYSGIIADKKGVHVDGVEGEIQKATDKVTIKIEDDKLYFLSKASFEVGTLESRPFKIIQNGEKLIAIDYEEDMVNAFLLNRKTGMAIWTKSRYHPIFFSDNPDTQSIYLICR